MPSWADPFDELASMFMSPDDNATRESPWDQDDSGQDPGAEEQTPVEVIVLGHLPMRAGLWIDPCAGAIARETGPTAFLRVDHDEPELSLWSLRSGTTPDFTGIDDLHDAVRLAGESTNRWILRVHSAVAPIAIMRIRPKRLTILTGADQMAVVEAYAMLKACAECVRKASLPVPQFGCVFAGVSEPVADSARTRLCLTAKRKLDLDLDVRCVVPRLGADRADVRKTFGQHAMPGLNELAELLRTTNDGSPGAPTTPPPAAVTPLHVRHDDTVGAPEVEVLTNTRTAPTASNVPTETTATDEAPGRQPMRLVGAPVRLPRVPATPSSSTEYGVSVMADRPTTDADIRHDRDATTQTSSRTAVHATNSSATRPVMNGTNGTADAPLDVVSELAAHLPGLAPIAHRCPMHPAIELACDDVGRLHLVARDRDVRELTPAMTWARQHASLLAAAARPARIDPAAAPVGHVVTADPRGVRDLQQSDVRLHLLAPVEVEGHQGWFCTPLN